MNEGSGCQRTHNAIPRFVPSLIQNDVVRSSGYCRLAFVVGLEALLSYAYFFA